MVQFMGNPVVIVGAGIGGLAAALDLARQDVPVLLLERDTGPGGKLATHTAGSAHIDVGPTVLTLRHVFDDLFADAGSDLQRVVPLQPLSVLARHAWDRMTRLDLYADPQASADSI